MPGQNNLLYRYLRRLLRFPRIFPMEYNPSSKEVLEREFLYDLTRENPGNCLFGRYDEQKVLAIAEKAGLLRGMARLGYSNPILSLSCSDPADQRICFYAGEQIRERLLLELRLNLSNFHPKRKIGPFGKEACFRMLMLLWLVLSDPDRDFPLDRPRLPGQNHPGLGLLDEVFFLLRTFARELSVDGMLDMPEHFHTALFYSRTFRYLDPEVEGRFLAISRDLKGVPLALASDAIRRNCLFDRSTGRPLPWQASEQVMTERGLLRKFFNSAEYREARDEARSKTRAIVNWDLYREKLSSGDR
ncbi:MAG: hypothetical protein FWF95_02665 [Syntrophorhabdaceae bacterium]|nr:hypothetical protein [Syntrophorhabdaceae bacterium]